MSGGQRQRVALGRALVRDPKVFLLDEPLSNLDAKLRAQMRTEITKLHKKLGTTFIYVTHDQVEAMTMGTRIVVMKLGYVQQIDTPMNLYNKPYNKFVAGFIGTPQMNFFNVKLNRMDKEVEVRFPDDSAIKLPYEYFAKIHDTYIHGGKDVILGIRPEHISLKNEKTGLIATVNAVEHLGNECIIYGVLGKPSEDFTMKDEGKNIIVKTVEGTPVNVGDEINLWISADKMHLFDSETEITLVHPIPKYSLFSAEINGENMKAFGSSVKLPGRLAQLIGDRKNVDLEIPPMAVVPGKDFELKVHQVEEVEGQRLAYLEFDNRYLFALVDDKVKAGAKYSFSLLNDKILVKDGDEVIHEPIGEKESLLGTFTKENAKVGKERTLDFHYVIEGYNILAPRANGFKMNAVEGNKCYKKVYKYVFLRDKIVLADEGLEANVKEIYEYGNIRYAVLDINGQQLLVVVDNEFKEEKVHIQLKGEDIEVWQREIDMMIC